ncbi:MAG: excinuclease ABC subunit UvrC [Candidatus Krumholzibacteria bacterium]|nr:excinuclease ABC subunit UvrC [Candidatus Krumholzibacteria bacterium]
MSRKRTQQDGKNATARPALEAKLRLLPDSPGVYLHKDDRGRVLYVGKAKRLKDRVRSYFQAGSEHEPKTAELVRHVADVDYIATADEVDALVIESQLIKEYRPRYNVRLKDDKQYPYLRISLGETFPRLSVVRRVAADGARYFGPYTDVRAMRETLKFAAGCFQVRTCSLDLPDRTVSRPCLDHQIGRCTAPCVDLVSPSAYCLQVRQLIAFLDGQDRALLSELKAQMTAHAQAREFEAAARERDRIAQLETTLAGGRGPAMIGGDADACGLVRDGTDACGVILRIRGDRLLTAHHFLLRDLWDHTPPAFLAQLLREYYPQAGDIPPLVLLSHELDDLATWSAWLTRLRGRRVDLRVPRRGRRRDAVALALKNAAFKLGERKLRDVMAGRGRVEPGDLALQEALGLHRVPETIECFDISNWQGRETVAALVYFKGGKPLKARYRRFRIRNVAGPDDVASMEEVLDRYYGKLAAKLERPADLVVVDGGVGQLGRARAVLARHGFADTDLIGLAKREETIMRESGPLQLSRRNPALQLLQRVRDEAHRFAITYHRLLRDQRTTASELDLIPGIGRVKKLSLLHHFGSVARLRSATAVELAEVRGLHERDVARILSYFADQPERDTHD